MRKRNNSAHNQTSRTGPATVVSSTVGIQAAVGAAIIILAVCFAYYPCLHGGFIWDDMQLITENPLINADNGLFHIWFTTNAIDYWPVTNSTFWIEWRLWGTDSTGYHITNFILHIFISFLIWIVLRRMAIPGAFMAALIFSVHPVNVESVAWIAQRKNLMAMLFFLLAILFYIKTLHLSPLASHPSRLYYWISLAAFFLAMLSKGSVAVLPALLLLIVWWSRPITTKDLLKTIPFLIVAGVLAGVNVWFQTHGEGESIRVASFLQSLLGAGGVIWFYLYKTLLPVNLLFVYPQWDIQPGNPLWWLPITAVVAVTLVLWRFRQGRMRSVFLAWCVFCISLVPVLGFIDVFFMRYSLVADHYQHIALIGVIALAAAGWSKWRGLMQNNLRWMAMITAVVTVVVLTFLTHNQSKLYSDEDVLFKATLEKNPECWLLHNNLGVSLAHQGNVQEAVQHYLQALIVKPEYADAHNNLGIELAKAGQTKEAIVHFEQALKVKKNIPQIYNSLGIAMVQVGRTDEGIRYFEQALELNRDLHWVYNNLGKTYKQIQQYDKALACYEQALEIMPDYYDAHYNMAEVLVTIGKYREAVDHYHKAIKLKPNQAETYANLAAAYAKLNQSSMAIASAIKGIEVAKRQGQPGMAETIEKLLNSYRKSLSGNHNPPPTNN